MRIEDVDTDTLLQAARKNRSVTAGQPAGASAPRIEDVPTGQLMEAAVRQGLMQVPAPDTTGLPTVRAPGGPPVLPPVPPGADWAKIAVPGPASAAAPAAAPAPAVAPAPGAAGGRKVTAAEAQAINPFFGDITPLDAPPGPYTNEASSQMTRAIQEQSFLHDVPPSGKRQLKPVHFATSPFEEALQHQNVQLDRLHQQLGREHQPVPGGPVDLLKRHAASTQAQLFGQLGAHQDGALWQDWNKAAQQYGAEDDRLQSRLHAWQQGRVTPRMAAQLSQDMQDHEANRQALMQRRAQLLHYSNAYVQTVQAYGKGPLNYGPYLPDEIAQRQGGSLGGDFAQNLQQNTLVGRALGWLGRNMNPLGSTIESQRQVDAARRQLMLQGQYPPLPLNPGHNPPERARLDREARQVRNLFFAMDPTGRLEVKAGMAVPGAGFIPGPNDLQFDRYLKAQHLTPWQQQLVPVLKQQAAAESEAVGSHTARGALTDAALLGLAEVGGRFVGRPLQRVLGRVLSPLEARLEASSLNPLVRAGAKLVTRTGAAATAHGTGAALAGGIGGAGMAAAEGQDWQDILNSARQGALQTAAIGAVMGAGGHLLSPRATVRAPASEFYHLPNKAAAAENRITLPDGTHFDLNQATRAEMEALQRHLPADHPAQAVLEQRLYGPPGSHTVADVTGRRFAARDLTPADVQSILDEYTQVEEQGGLAPAQAGNRQAVEQHRALQERHAADQVLPVRPEAHQDLRKAYRKEPVLGEGQEHALASAADALQGPKPEVARTLRAAASTIKSDFQTDYRQTDNVSTGATPAREEQLPAPERSAWRKLTPDEQAALPERLRRTLILQDIHNSGTIIEPSVSPRDFVTDLSKRSTSWLEGEADRRWQQAEGKFAAGRSPVSDVTVQAPAPAGEQLSGARGAHGAAQGEVMQQLTRPGAPDTGEAQARLDEARQRLREAHVAHAESSATAAQGQYVDALTRLGPDAPETRAALDEYRIAREQEQASKVAPRVEPPTPEATVAPPALEEARQTRKERRAAAKPAVERAKPAAPKPAPAEAAPAVNPVKGFPREKLQPGQAIQKVDAEGKALGPRERVVRVGNRTVTYTDSETGKPVTQRLDKFERSPFVPVEQGPQEGRKGGEVGGSKPLWELSLDELDAAHEAAKHAERSLEERLFGAEGAARYRQLQRRANSVHASFPEVDAATRAIEQMEATLTESQQRQLFGVGPENAAPAAEEIRDYQRDLAGLDRSSATGLGDSLKYALTKVGQETDPARMSGTEQIAYATLREGFRIARREGFDTAEVTKAAVSGAAARFPDPADAAFMLRRYLQDVRDIPEMPRGKALPPGKESGSKGGDVGRKPGGKSIAPEEFARAGEHLQRRNALHPAAAGRLSEERAARQHEAQARGIQAQFGQDTGKQRFLREVAESKPHPEAIETPTVKKNLANLADARTGQPVEFTGFRAESRGGRIPETGTFYAATPGHAMKYAFGVAAKELPLDRPVPRQRMPSFDKLTVQDLRFQNPLVLNGGHHELNMASIAGHLGLDRTEQMAIAKAKLAATLRGGDAGYALLDKAIAAAARRKGYDSIIFRKGGGHLNTEIVDLRLHEAGTDGNGRPVRQPAGAPAKDVSDWQHWGLHFPAGWEMNGPKPVIDPEGEIGRKGGLKRTGAARQAIEEVAEPQVADTFHRARGNPVETDASPVEATKNLIVNGALGVKRFVAGFRRTFPDLVARDDPELHRMLVERIDGVTNAAQMAQRRIHDALRHLSPDERDLWEFRRFVTSLVTDAGKQRERHLRQGFAADQFKAVLPDGITEAQAKLTQQKLDQHIAQKAKQAGLDPAKLDAADQAVTGYRNAIVPVFDHLYHEVNGVDLKLRDNIETYMRHQILFLDQVLGEGTGPRTRIDANPRAGHLQAQLGSELPYNTNWVEAEMNWLPKMIRQIGDLEIIKHIKDNYDIAPAMRLAEAEMNAPGMIAALQGHAAGTPISQAHTDGLARMAAEHRLPDRIDGHYRGLLNALLQLHTDNTRLTVAGQASIPLSPEMQGVLKEYAGFLQKPEKDGLVSIRSIVDDPRWQQRNNYAEFQPIEGRHFYQALTVPEKLLQAAMSGADVLLDPEQLRQVRAVGAKRRTMVVPVEMKRLLEGYTPAEYRNDRSFVLKGLDVALKLWKWDKLYNPAHSAIYFLNNARSDAEATFRGHTRAYWDLIPRSVELVKFMRGGEASPILKEWLDRNGLGSTFVASAEMQTGVGLNPLAKYATRDQPVWKQRTTAAKRALHNTLILPHEWREATFRYTNFYTWVKEIENNGGMPKSFGASDSTEIRGISNIYDKAMALSNDLIGPYNKVSAGGQWLRKNAFPFWSWQEVLVHRELQLFRNAVMAPRIAMEAGQRLSAGRAGLVWGGAMARYFAGVAAWGASVEAMNRLRFGAQYRQALPKALRGRTEPVMLWRRDPATGQLLYLDKPTNLGDFADIFHLNGIPGYVEAIGKGQMTKTEMVEDMLWNGLKERLIQQAGPHLKMPLELLTGLALYPDPNRPHKVTMAQSIARELSLDKAYTLMQGLPMSPPARIRLFGKEIGGRAPAATPFIGGQDMIHLLNTNVLDLSEANFFDAKSDAAGWLARRKQASGVPGSESDAMHDAAYYFRLSLRYGDQKSAEQALWQYARLGGTDKAMKASLWGMQPLHGLEIGDQARYLEQLHPDDRERLRSAYLHWANIVAPDIHPGEYQKLPFAEFLPGLRQAVKGSLQREWGSTAKLAMGHRIDQGRSLDPAIRKVQEMGETDRTQYLAALSPVGGERLKERYRQFAGRAAPDMPLAVDEKLPLADWVEKVDEKIAEYRRGQRQKANQEAAYRGRADAEMEVAPEQAVKGSRQTSAIFDPYHTPQGKAYERALSQDNPRGWPSGEKGKWNRVKPLHEERLRAERQFNDVLSGTDMEFSQHLAAPKPPKKGS